MESIRILILNVQRQTLQNTDMAIMIDNPFISLLNVEWVCWLSIGNAIDNLRHSVVVETTECLKLSIALPVTWHC